MLTAGCQRVSLPSSPTRGLMRPMHDLLRLGLIALTAAAGACVQRADLATEERVIRDLDKKWVQAVAARDTTASSADIAYETGSYHLGYDVAPKGKRVKGKAVKSRRVEDTGKYVVAWKK